MWLYVLGFIVPMVTIFFKVLQQQNVIHGRKGLAATTSFVMSALDIAMIGLVVNNGWHLLLPAGCGGALGVVLSMYLHPYLLRLTDKEPS